MLCEVRCAGFVLVFSDHGFPRGEQHFYRLQCKPHDVAVAPTRTCPGKSARTHDVSAAPLPDHQRVGAFREEPVPDSEASLNGVRLGGLPRVIRELQFVKRWLQVRGQPAVEGKRVWLFGCAFSDALEQEQLAFW